MPSTKTSILVAFNSINVYQDISHSLDEGHVMHQATSGDNAWNLLKSTETISIMFIDMNLPTVDSLLLIKKIREDESQRIASLPVIIITDHKNIEAAKYVSDIIGATSFIIHPFESSSISKLVNSYARVNKSTSFEDQTVTHDPLTSCLTENGLIEHCSRVLDYANFSYEDTSLLCIQVVDFENTFKGMDQNIIDQVIITLAKHLNKECRVEEKVAYLGNGRFFIVLLTTNSFRAYMAGVRLQKKVASLNFLKDGNKLPVKVAIGISATDNNKDRPTVDTLRLQAEQALQASLDLPGSHVVRYDSNYEKGYDEKIYRS